MRAQVIVGDCREVLDRSPAASFDACVTDPPYGLGFMGRGWDRGVPGVEFWTAILRTMKPGAHLFAFGGTRTFHRLACAIEDAGWEIRDCLCWLYGSGFPKSHNGPWGGTALKPAWEPIVMARKPLVGTVAENVERYGIGGLNVDGCRIGTDDVQLNNYPPHGKEGATSFGGSHAGEFYSSRKSSGRWPSNVCMDEEAAAMLDEQAGQSSSSSSYRPPDAGGTGNVWTVPHPRGGHRGHDDAGGRSRFFYCAKASRGEREAGLEGLPVRSRGDVTGREDASAGANNPRAGIRARGTIRNIHPTVKPIALMRWLIRLAVPPGGRVLDPFCGSGTTGCAAVAEGVEFVGVDLDPDHAEISRARISFWGAQGRLNLTG